jgi:hypothetical protein
MAAPPFAFFSGPLPWLILAVSNRSLRCRKQRRYLAIRDPEAQHSSSGDCSVAATWARLREDHGSAAVR